MIGDNDNWNSLPKAVRVVIVASFNVIAAGVLWFLYAFAFAK